MVGAPSFLRRVAVTYASFTAANCLSNVILFPDKKLDYGILNGMLDRPVQNKWWGTRLEHVSAVGLPLAIADQTYQLVWKYSLLPRLGYPRGTVLCFAKTPAAMLVHGFIFVLTGIMAFVTADAAFNPLYEGKDRKEVALSKLYPSIRGSQCMWVLPVLRQVTQHFTKIPVVHGTLPGLLPPTLVFSVVKGHQLDWPWGSNLTPFEVKLNNAPVKTSSNVIRASTHARAVHRSPLHRPATSEAGRSSDKPTTADKTRSNHTPLCLSLILID